MNTASPLANHRKISLIAGIFYLLTFISVPTLSLYDAAKDSGYILRDGSDTSALIAVVLELVMALACIASAVTLYPILKRQNQSMALGLVASRVLEAGTIFAGVAFILGIVALRRAEAGEDALPVSQALSMLYDRMVLIGQSLLPAVNDVLLGLLLYQSRLVPRWLSGVGIIGVLPLVIGFAAMLFDVIEQGSALAGLAAVLVALFEIGLGIWLVAKGFDTQSVAELASRSQ